MTEHCQRRSLSPGNKLKRGKRRGKEKRGEKERGKERKAIRISLFEKGGLSRDFTARKNISTGIFRRGLFLSKTV